jgi:hypothetical protein
MSAVPPPDNDDRLHLANAQGYALALTKAQVAHDYPTITALSAQIHEGGLWPTVCLLAVAELAELLRHVNDDPDAIAGWLDERLSRGFD